MQVLIPYHLHYVLLQNFTRILQEWRLPCEDAQHAVPDASRHLLLPISAILWWRAVGWSGGRGSRVRVKGVGLLREDGAPELCGKRLSAPGQHVASTRFVVSECSRKRWMAAANLSAKTVPWHGVVEHTKQPWHLQPCFGPLAFYDVAGKVGNQHAGSTRDGQYNKPRILTDQKFARIYHISKLQFTELYTLIDKIQPAKSS
eukprot:scaffold58063_cov19-Tisochrysis_lutea.AAC.8